VNFSARAAEPASSKESQRQLTRLFGLQLNRASAAAHVHDRTFLAKNTALASAADAIRAGRQREPVSVNTQTLPSRQC
jgi:hypothetical protein